MVKLTQHSWLGGQLDPEMGGRQDVDRYRAGATLIRNFLPQPRGGLRKRPGTDLVCDISDFVNGEGVTGFRMVPFSFSSDTGYVIILAGTASGSSARVYSRSSGFYANVREPGSAYDTPAALPFTGTELADIRVCQCGDILFIAHPDHPPSEIRHTSGSVFEWREIPCNLSNDGVPFISGAVMKRLYIATASAGATKTERYKVSAVRDGIETVCSAEFFGQTVNDSMKTPSGPCSVSTTSYHLPWTESQTITLTINPNNGNGQSDPEEIRVYKKGGAGWGLIGSVSREPVSRDADPSGLTRFDGEGSAVTSAAEPRAFGAGSGGWYATDGVIDLGATVKVRRVTVWLGHLVCRLTSDADGTVTAAEGWLAQALPRNDISGAWVRVLRSTTATFSTTTVGSAVQITNGLASADAGHFQRDFPGGVTRDTALAWLERKAKDTLVTHTATFEAAAAGVDARYLKIQAALTSNFSEPIAGGTIAVTEDSGGPTGFATESLPVVVSGVRIDGVETYTFADDNIIPDMSLAPVEETEVFSAAGEYPSTVALYQQRLVWAGSRNDPARIWMSKTGDFYTYAAHEVPVADDPIDFQLPITRFAAVRHLLEMRDLIAFSEACEWIIASSGGGLAYDTIEARPHSQIGCDGRLAPIVCNNAALFAERTGMGVRRYGYQLQDDGYGGRDLAVFSRSILAERRIVSWAYQQHPDPLVWMCLSDGSLAALLFAEDTEQGVSAWSTHELGGGGKAKAVAQTHALQASAGLEGAFGEVLLIVRRGTAFTLEALRPWPRADGDGIGRVLCLDSARTLAAGDILRTGELAFRPATGAAVAADAWVAGDVAGFTFAARMDTVRPAISDSEVGAAQTDVKLAHSVAVRARGAGGTVRAYGAAAERAARLEAAQPKLRAAPETRQGQGAFLATPECDARVVLAGDNSRDGRVTLEQDGPWPLHITLMEIDYETEIG